MLVRTFARGSHIFVVLVVCNFANDLQISHCCVWGCFRRCWDNIISFAWSIPNVEGFGKEHVHWIHEFDPLVKPDNCLVRINNIARNVGQPIRRREMSTYQTWCCNGFHGEHAIEFLKGVCHLHVWHILGVVQIATNFGLCSAIVMENLISFIVGFIQVFMVLVKPWVPFVMGAIINYHFFEQDIGWREQIALHWWSTRGCGMFLGWFGANSALKERWCDGFGISIVRAMEVRFGLFDGWWVSRLFFPIAQIVQECQRVNGLSVSDSKRMRHLTDLM